jgi:hypothetical protein
MKIFLKAFVAVLFTGTILSSCSPEAHKEIGEPRDIVASLAGNWTLTKAVEVDEDAVHKGFPYKENDITAIFPYTDFKLTLVVNGSTPSTFTTTPGSSPKIIHLASGTWAADNLQYPKVLTLTSGSTTETVTLGSYPIASSTKLQLNVSRSDAGSGKLLITYKYEFSKL